MHKSVSLTEAPSDEDQHQNQMESGCKGVECEYDLISDYSQCVAGGVGHVTCTDFAFSFVKHFYFVGKLFCTFYK